MHAFPIGIEIYVMRYGSIFFRFDVEAFFVSMKFIILVFQLKELLYWCISCYNQPPDENSLSLMSNWIWKVFKFSSGILSVRTRVSMLIYSSNIVISVMDWLVRYSMLSVWLSKAHGIQDIKEKRHKDEISFEFNFKLICSWQNRLGRTGSVNRPKSSSKNI